jgi:hypothetical protein
LGDLTGMVNAPAKTGWFAVFAAAVAREASVTFLPVVRVGDSGEIGVVSTDAGWAAFLSPVNRPI